MACNSTLSVSLNQGVIKEREGETGRMAKTIVAKIAETDQQVITKNQEGALQRSITKKIENTTKGLTPSYSKRLGILPSKHITVICDYLFALSTEIKLSYTYRQSILDTLMPLARCVPNKRFKDFTRADVITYLNQFKKEEDIDPAHKWIGTYNVNLINVIRFFKWLYSPDSESTKRPKPRVVQNLPRLRRREISGYKPADMWVAEDNLIFLKYCPSPRDRCYHAMEVDTGARPHELLNLRIKDIEFLDEGVADGGRYAKIVVNGKTGERSLQLTDSIPYVTQWISNNHTQGSNRDAVLLPNLRTGKTIHVNGMFKAYAGYKKYFTSLLSSEDVPDDDKQKIKKLLNKKWNPYVYRHSAITEKSGLLSSDAKLRQYAGWTARSNMHHKYVHFGGGESMKDLLRAKGILKDEKQSINILQPKTCPHCREPNRPDAQFCFKCNFVMSFEAYQKGKEERHRKDQEILELKEQMLKMQKDLQDIKEFERRGLRDGRKIFSQGMKQVGKDLKTIIPIDSLTSPELIESFKGIRVNREVVVEELIAFVKDEGGYEETHPEIKKARELLQGQRPVVFSHEEDNPNPDTNAR